MSAVLPRLAIRDALLWEDEVTADTELLEVVLKRRQDFNPIRREGHDIAVAYPAIPLDVDGRFDIKDHATLQRLVRAWMQAWPGVVIDGSKAHAVPGPVCEIRPKAVGGEHRPRRLVDLGRRHAP